MVWLYHGNVGRGTFGFARSKGEVGLGLLLVCKCLPGRVVIARLCRWFVGSAAGLFRNQRAGPQAQRSSGDFVANDEKTKGLLPRAREEREARELTYEQMGEILGLSEHQIESGAVQGYEAGMPVRNGSVVRIYQGLQRARLQAGTWLALPRFSVVRDGRCVVLHHNEWPRFVSKAVPEKLHKEQWRFAKAAMPVYELRPETGLAQMIFSFIDHVPEGVDAEDVMEEAVATLERFVFDGGGRG